MRAISMVIASAFALAFGCSRGPGLSLHSEDTSLTSSQGTSPRDPDAGCNIEPADPAIAVGPNEIVQMTNCSIQVFDSNLAPVTSSDGGIAIADLSTFIDLNMRTSVNNYATDPRIIYDAITGRFYYTAIASDRFNQWQEMGNTSETGSLFVGYSKQGQVRNLFDGWCRMKWPDVWGPAYDSIQQYGYQLDYPGIGSNGNAIWIGLNIYAPGLVGLGYPGLVFSSAAAIGIVKPTDDSCNPPIAIFYYMPDLPDGGPRPDAGAGRNSTERLENFALLIWKFARNRYSTRPHQPVRWRAHFGGVYFSATPGAHSSWQ